MLFSSWHKQLKDSWFSVTRKCQRTPHRPKSRRLIMEMLEDRTVPAVWLVDLATDPSVIDPGHYSLRQAINAAAPGDTIQFDGALSGQTIHLDSVQGPLQLTKDVTITGLGAQNISVSGNNATRVFQIDVGVSATLTDLTIANGWNNVRGGGIANAGTLTIDRSVLSSNRAYQYGGGIDNRGTLTMNDSAISGSVSSYSVYVNGGGGAIYNDHGTATLTNSTLSGNTSSQGGGGIYNNYATLTLTNSTVANNSSFSAGGGALFNLYSTATITNSTLSGNSGRYGGAIRSFYEATVIMTNTIVAGNPGQYGDVLGGIASLGFNLIGPSPSGGGWIPTDFVNATASLGPLTNNGGSTQTMTPLPGSLAIDTGNPSLAAPSPYDQRGTGYDRVSNGRVDIGAVEVQVVPPGPVETPSTQVTTLADSVDPYDNLISLREAITHANNLPGADTITFAPALSGATFNLSRGVLPVTSDITLPGNGEIVQPLGPGALYSGSGAFYVSGADSKLTMDHLTIQNFSAGAIQVGPDGGPLAIDSVNFLSNHGGATIILGGTGHSLTNSLWQQNSGAVSIGTSGSVTISGATFDGNSASNGGAIVMSYAGMLTLENSTVKNNSAVSPGGGFGGGIYAFQSSLAITNVTFVGNTTSQYGYGGAVFVQSSSATITNATLVANSAGIDGGAICSFYATLTLTNSILWGNTTLYDGNQMYDLGSTITATYSNIQGGWAGDGNIDTDPLLDALADNGGPTQTMALLPGSPAINAGTTLNAPPTDQRGVLRDEIPDMGAFEAPVYNHDPVANDFSVMAASTFTIVLVLDHASDVDIGDTLTVDSVTQGAYGTVTINPTGTVSYTLTHVFSGTDTFTYTVSDGHGGFATATVTVHVEMSAAFDILRTEIGTLPLNNGEKNSLLSKVDATQKSLMNGNKNAAVNQLTAYINQVRAFQKSQRLDAAQADLVINEVEKLMGLVESGDTLLNS